MFGLPMGVDFSTELIAGLDTRLTGQGPEAIARVELIVNTTRMRRRLRSLYTDRGAGFLPRIRLLTELGPPVDPSKSSRLLRKLELSQLVRALLEREKKLAPRAAVFDLADSLLRLLDEIEGEAVPLEALQTIDVGQLSEYWSQALKFINIIAPFLSEPENTGPEALQRTRIVSLIADWAKAPPQHPVLLAGSTGSRGTTALLMDAVAQLPQGAIILPGFDFDQPGKVWTALEDALTSEDHPQFRFARLLDRNGLTHRDVDPWTATAPAASSRNALVSLALRPAPVTDQWLSEGPYLSDLTAACAGMTLVEAPNERIEAQAIALCLRNAANAGKTAALVTPDRVLSRRVAAALDRWRIVPDDSAGRPLNLSPPGRFLRQLARELGQAVRADALIALLKHPLTHSSANTRGAHLKLARDLELHLRKRNIAQPTSDAIRSWAAARPEPEAEAWGNWLAALMQQIAGCKSDELSVLEAQHRDLAELLARGDQPEGSGTLWDLAAGEEALRVMDQIQAAAPSGGTVSLDEYVILLDSTLAAEVVREPVFSHPDIMIWGTLEARVQTVDVAILGGLNDGIWPPLPAADPWMNRVMRAQAGLLLPERQIGLSAHDFQQAIGAQEVVLTRAIRGDEAETVPSRWLNRLTNLLDGLNDESKAALAKMRQAGNILIAQAERLDLPATRTPAAHRPAPRPPKSHRPTELPVTSIERLVRDPYAVYASHILRLRTLPMLGQAPDARDRGSIFHKIMETFIPKVFRGELTLRSEDLELVAKEVVANAGFSPEISAFWRAHITRIAEAIVTREAPRQQMAADILTETRGVRTTGDGFRLTCRADRLDLGHDGKLRIFDYKSTPPSSSQLKIFDFQLHLEAAIAEAGGVHEIGPVEIAELAYLSLSASKCDLSIEVGPEEPHETWQQFCDLIAHWQSESAGFTARRMMRNSGDPSDYDHLSRHGEWEISEKPKPEDVG
ncbi:MAG: double-strand break repair protein AddB [Dinoroseobacter sp.]|nr:double-strand break repair protein AddB [Dinoroseobacter sp.]